MTALLLLLLTIAWLVLLTRVVVDLLTMVVPVGTAAHHPLARVRAVVHTVTEPVLAPIRRVLPPVRLGAVALDLSVVVAFVAITLLRGLLAG